MRHQRASGGCRVQRRELGRSDSVATSDPATRPRFPIRRKPEAQPQPLLAAPPHRLLNYSWIAWKSSGRAEWGYVKIVLPGGTGFLGRHIGDRLVARGDEVVVLTRGRSANRDGRRFVTWDSRTVGEWASELEQADAVVHLSGKRVDCRPTRANINELIRSRVQSVTAIGTALQRTGRVLPICAGVDAGHRRRHRECDHRRIDGAVRHRPPPDGAGLYPGAG